MTYCALTDYWRGYYACIEVKRARLVLVRLIASRPLFAGGSA